MIQKYFAFCEDVIQRSPFVVSYTTHVEVGSPSMGHMKGVILFIDSSELTFFELVSQEQYVVNPVRFRFHYKKGDTFIFQYDNAPHHGELPSFPDHKHVPGGVESSTSLTFQQVFQKVSDMLVISEKL